MLTQDFHRDRALAGDHVRIVEGMHEYQIALAAKFRRMFVGLIVIIAVQI